MDEKGLQKTLDHQVAIPRYRNYKKGFILEEFVELYNQGDLGLNEIGEKLGVSGGRLLQIIKEYKIPRRPKPNIRFNFSYKLIETPSYLANIVQDRDLYKLSSAYCDYMAKKIDSNKCILIEEKETLSNYNHGYAVLQLLIGEQIVTQNLNVEVESKILFCHKSKQFKKGNVIGKSEYFIVDVKDYLNIDIIIDSEHNSTNIIQPKASRLNGEKIEEAKRDN